MRLICRFHSKLDPFQVYQNVFSDAEQSFFLDSLRYQKPDQRYSYIGCAPASQIFLQNRKTVWLEKSKRHTFPDRALLSVMRRALIRFKMNADPKPFFTGGLVGYLGYETAEIFDKIRFLKKRNPDVPDACFGLYQEVIVYDHKHKHYWLVANARSEAQVRAAVKRLKSYFHPPLADPKPFKFGNFQPEIGKKEFQRKVRKAKDYIGAGDIYQANLSQKFHFEYAGSPLKIYAQLRKINPSPFSSFLRFGENFLVSSSPERLIRKKGRICETRPIAGTHPRTRRDRMTQRALLASEKERAEHIMLLDLERNDLGKVCDYRSVKVDEMLVTEKYSHVIHLVSKVTGRLRKNKNAFDLIRAVFPGGTITGCPKIRCMEIIEELEPSARGIYTGSLGYIDFKQDLDLNIIIRTLLLSRGRGYLQVGAGIVFDSDETREYQETLHKGEALKQALKAAARA